MSVTRWDPFRELEEVSDRLNRLFGRRELPGSASGREAVAVPDWVPAVDVTENVEEYLIKAELPEINKQDINISVQDDVLTIQGERKRELEEKGKKFRRVERSYGMFQRSFTLPDDVEEEKIRADFKDGMLYLHLPKAPKPKPKAIDVRID